MKIIYQIFGVFFISSTLVIAQQRGNVWCFGDSCLINFNTTPPSTGYSLLRSRGTACSIANSSGNLLFYCGTPRIELWQSGMVYFWGAIYNKNHDIMDNGDTIAAELQYNEMIIINDPNLNSRYYLFQLKMLVSDTGLFYSVIDLSYNNGLGKVTSKNVKLLDGYMTDGLAAIKHGNGRDWWVLARKSNFLLGGPPDNDFYLFLVDTVGITQQPVQNIGTLNPTNGGKITFNPMGDKFVFTNLQDLIELYDFDRCTGVISNPVTIQPNAPGNSKHIWGAEFSSEGRYFYVSTSLDTSFLYQYDTYATNIGSSRIVIDIFDSLTYAGGALKRGPDGKIYYASAWNDGMTYNFPYPDTEYNTVNMYLGVINQPDSPGVACDFQPFSFYLGGKRNYWGLPNNPDYDLPPLHGSACDTLHVQVKELANSKAGLLVFPNPSNGIVNFSSGKSANDIVQITDAAGRIVSRTKLNNGHTSINTPDAGIYYAGILVNGMVQSYQKFIVIK